MSLEPFLQRAARHRILAGIGTNLIAELARAATLPVIAVIAARYLGAGGYGVLATGQVLVAFAATLTGFGLLYAVLQLGSRREESLASLLSTGTVAALATAVVTYAVLALWVSAFDYDAETRRATYIMGASLFATALTGQLTAGLQVEGRYTLIAVAGVASTLLNVAYAVAVVAADRGIMALAAAPIVATVSNAAVLAWGLRDHLSFEVNIARARQMLRTGFLFGLGDFLYFIYFSIDLVILSLIAGEREVGLYNIPVRILVVAYLVPMVLFNRVLYPRYFDWSTSDRRRLQNVFVTTSRGVLLAGLMAAALLVLVAEPLVPAVFGGSFGESADLLRILALAVPLRYLSSSASALLTTGDRMAERVRVQASAAVFNVALCLALIPFWEAMGAAIATVVTEAFLLIAYLALARREFLQGLVAIRQRVWLLSAPAAALVVGAIVTGPEWVPAVCGGLAIAGLAVLFGPYFGRNLLKPLTWGRVEEEGSVTA